MQRLVPVCISISVGIFIYIYMNYLLIYNLHLTGLSLSPVDSIFIYLFIFFNKREKITLLGHSLKRVR